MLSIENLSVEYYRRGQVIEAVRDFSLAIKPGETVGLVGESGSGKSTVALAILRLIRSQEGRITSGRILFGGEDLLALPDDRMRAVRGKRISMIFQDPFTALNPVMRIREQMAEVLTAHEGRGEKGEGGQKLPLRPSPLAHRLSEALERVQLDPARVLDSYPHQLSGGQRQRALIAIALLTRPELILADEPTTALDVLVQKEVLDLLFRLQKDIGMSMLFISHNLSLVGQYTQRMLVMKDGCIIEQGHPTQLFRNPHQSYTQSLVQAIPRLPEQ